jgi:hypothetical protein
MATESNPKRDLKKELKHLYGPLAKTVTLVDVPPLNFLMIDGMGDPNMAQAYQDAVETLYAAAYALKFMSKNDPGIDYVVMPLEGLWWAEPIEKFSLDRRDLWRWTAMIMQPDHITAEMVEKAVAQARAKKNPPSLDKLRFDMYHEGLAAQILYTGPYAEEGPTIQRIHEWIEAQGYTYHGAKAHHEVYLSDPRRTAPEKLKTVIRQPMRVAE